MGDALTTDKGFMTKAHYIGVALAPILREQGLWGNREPLDKLRDMAALSHAALAAIEEWEKQEPTHDL